MAALSRSVDLAFDAMYAGSDGGHQCFVSVAVFLAI